MNAAETVFWVMAALVLYTYIGYPALLALAGLFGRRKEPPEPEDWPSVSVLVVAFNEGAQIERKIANVLRADYPEDRIEVIVCSDGSTDATNAKVETYGDPRVKLAASEVNRGVNEAFAMGAEGATGDLLLLTDSGGLFEPDALKIAIRHFADPKVGCVNGLFEHQNPEGRAIASGHQGYWAIETPVRLMETKLGLGCVIVGAFEVIRRELYRPIASAMSNDMIVPMEVKAAGFRVVYEPKAVLKAPQQKRGKQEFRRRVRVAVRGWSSLPEIARRVKPWKTPLNWLALWSHKYMRWLTGGMLLGAVVANAFLLDRLIYQVTFAPQAAFYACALLGALLSRVLRKVPRLLAMPYWFCLVQAAGLVGLVQALFGRTVATWKPEP